LQYINHLYDNTTDGYVQVLQLKEGQAIIIKNTQSNGVFKLEVENKEDLFISPNTFYIPKRATKNIRQFRALYIDIDLKQGLTVNDVLQEVYYQVVFEKIPEPSMIVNSGRGIHLYWRIENAPYAAIDTWQQLEDYLFEQLKHIGADARATDASRVLRIPGTINSRVGKKCEIIKVNDDLQYSMYDLREKYLNWGKKKKQTKKVKTTSSNVVNLFNSYTLHMARLQDIEKLLEMRKYDVKGYRNMFIHLYAYWAGIYIRDEEQLKEEVYKLNEKFKEPLKKSEVDAVLRCIPKAIEAFREWAHSDRKISSTEKKRYGYWYTNATLIERLGISEEEQRHLKTIISKEEKYKRKNEKRNKNRRNEEGLTPKQAELKELKEKAEQLLNEGYQVKEVINKLNISRAKLYRILNN